MNSPFNYDGQQDLISPDVFLKPVDYAGFWLRMVAYILDIAILYGTAFIILFVFGGFSKPETSEGAAIFEFLFLIFYIALLLYFPLMESSKWQATLGKRAVGIIVADINGERVSFGKALARLFSKIISGIILYIGFIMAGFTGKKQGLHDMIANTLVIKKWPV